MELSQDLIGTNPKYMPIIDHSWLNVDTKAYDNFPSDNNPVRIQPKLSELWNHGNNTGLNLIPNTICQPLRVRNAEIKGDIIRETKKAMMAGFKGKELAEYIRDRFSSEDIITAKEDLAKLSEEQGLLGNVYVDISAFTSAKEAEQFFLNNRNRLAQNIVVNECKISPDVVSILASKFHKNVVASMSYDIKLFEKYKNHLVEAGVIGKDFVIDSKESLRNAFLYGQPQEEKVSVSIVVQEKKLSSEEEAKELLNRSEKLSQNQKRAQEEINFKTAYPIVEFARQQLSKGKTGSDLKEILLSKFSLNDIKTAAKYIALVASDQRVSFIDKFVESGKIQDFVGLSLKKLAFTYPLPRHDFENVEKNKNIGTKGYLYALSGKKIISDENHKYAVESLKNGVSTEKVKEELLKKISSEEADVILIQAIKDFNTMSAGVKANVAKRLPKEKIVEDLRAAVATLPDPETIAPQIKDILSYYQDVNGTIEIDSSFGDNKTTEIGGLSSRSGIDSAL